MDALKAKLKEGGSLFDGSFNSELIKISSKDYYNLMRKLVYDKEEKRKGKKAIKEFKKLKQNGFFNVTNKIFNGALEEGGAQGIKLISSLTSNLLLGEYGEVLKYVEPLLSKQ
jgi:hypothetical protein